MADQSTVEAYNKIAGEFHSRNNAPLYEELYALFASHIKSGDHILDIGCGTGRDAEELVKLGLEYTGIDASEGMLAIARGRVKAGRFILGNFYKLNFPDNTFDGFWAAASFLHAPKTDMPILLQEAKRVTKSNGIGFISLKQKTLMDEGYIKETKAGGIERYFAFYTKEEFKNILEKYAFEILSTRIKIEKDGTNWLCSIVKSKK